MSDPNCQVFQTIQVKINEINESYFEIFLVFNADPATSETVSTKNIPYRKNDSILKLTIPGTAGLSSGETKLTVLLKEEVPYFMGEEVTKYSTHQQEGRAIQVSLFSSTNRTQYHCEGVAFPQ